MRKFTLYSIFLIAILTSCQKNEEVINEEKSIHQATDPIHEDPQIAAVLQDQIRQQSSALETAKVVINGAWNYTGFSFLSPDPNSSTPARLIAVDVTISGQTRFFDVDDMEVVDGVTNFSYGSDPHFAYLNVNTGKLLPGNEMPAAAPKANRILLIYGFPKTTNRVKVAYWNKIQTKEAVDIADVGWEIPHPPAQ